MIPRLNLAANKYLIIGVLVAVFFGGQIISFFTGKHQKARFIDNPGSQPTISPEAASALSDQLFQAMDRPGTDEGKIFSALSGLSRSDFKAVYDAFGFQYRDDILGVQGGWLMGNRKRDLIYWLTSELSASELRRLATVNPEMAFLMPN